jgi:hypothetical protein
MQGVFECSASERGHDKCLAHILKSSVILQQYRYQVCRSLFFSSPESYIQQLLKQRTVFPSKTREKLDHKS